MTGNWKNKLIQIKWPKFTLEVHFPLDDLIVLAESQWAVNNFLLPIKFLPFCKIVAAPKTSRK